MRESRSESYFLCVLKHPFLLSRVKFLVRAKLAKRGIYTSSHPQLIHKHIRSSQSRIRSTASQQDGPKPLTT